MTTKFILTAVASSFLAVAAFAQANITGKVFVAEVNGSVTYVVGGKVIKLQKGASLPVEGAHIETASGASLVLVYSNGTSIYIDEDTIVDIRRFVQKPFTPGVDTTAMEPSTSETLARITQGRIIVTTNELATGTSMVYQTPQSQVRIRGHEVVIEVQNSTTNVLLVSGDVTVTPVNAAPGDIGQALHSGETAVITSNVASTTAPATIQIAQTNPSVTIALAPKFASTERAQSTVVFQSVTTPAGNSTDSATTVIQAQAVVPAAMPVQLTVSPSTLRTGS
ncbi:MAG TPA: FecR domain-containing protein [Opitutaceae bacterium]|nr:FecR domain-containing protein [Opitutaceae bacterium]